MKYILILLLGLITFQVKAQKIIGSTTTAGGDLQGTYPDPQIKSNVVNRSNLTPTLRDSLLRFRKDTSIVIGSGTTSLSSLTNTFGKYNRVRITCLLPSAGTASVVLPSLADTLKNTEFKVTLYAQDSSSAVMNIVGFDGFTFYFNGTSLQELDPIIYISNRKTITLKGVYQSSNWMWLSEVSTDWLGTELEEIAATGITALTGDVTASGTGSVAATIAADAVTSAKILNSTIVSADIASQTIDSVDVKNRSITTIKLEDGAVTSLKVLDNSLTGSDLTYLTLRAGTTSNASLQLTSGSDKTTLTGGEIMYNGSRFAVGIGSSKKRVTTTNDASPSNGQIPIGNGSDYTMANITAGSNISITNGSGSITIATTPWKRDTTVAYDNTDYTLLSTGLTSAQVLARYNNIWITGRVPASGVSSDALLALPSPVADYNQVTIHLFSLDQNATYNIGISAPTNSIMLGDGTYTNAYPSPVVAGQLIKIRCVIDPSDSNNYKWIVQ